MWEQPLHNAHEVESSYGKPSWATAVQFRRRCMDTAYLPGVAGDGGEDPPHGAHMVGGPRGKGEALGIQCGRQRHGLSGLPGVAGDGGEDPSHDAHAVEGFPGVDLGGVVPVKGLQDESALLLDHLF